jgi:hypothetical protein
MPVIDEVGSIKIAPLLDPVIFISDNDFTIGDFDRSGCRPSVLGDLHRGVFEKFAFLKYAVGKCDFKSSSGEFDLRFGFGASGGGKSQHRSGSDEEELRVG